MVRDLRLVCVSRRQETADVVTFGFRSEDGDPLRHLPGQALTLALPVKLDTLWRTFTIASSPSRKGTVELTVKAAPDGDATRWMHEHLLPGTAITARGPLGRFSLAHHHAPSFALISAGSGITPMMSMLRWLADRGETVDVVFVHAARTPADILFADELQRLDARMPNLRLAITVSRVPEGESWSGYRGRIDRKMLGLIVPGLSRRETFCCGPAGFSVTVERIHRAEGGDPARFHTESFGSRSASTILPENAFAAVAAPPSKSPAKSVTLTIGDRRIEAMPGELLLSAARAAGVVIPTGCREGLCGACRVQCLAGDVEMHHKGGLSAREERQGYVLACCSRLKQDLTIALDPAKA